MREDEVTALSAILSRLDICNESRYGCLIRVKAALDRFSQFPSATAEAQEGRKAREHTTLSEKYGNIVDVMQEQNKFLEELTERLEKIM